MRKKKQKKIFISATAILLAGAIGYGIWFGLSHSQKDPVLVVPFSEIGMTEYWGDNMESHGPVSSDNIQTVFLSDTQTVTEVLVKEGDTVKKGDPMMTFDTTLSGLDLERKRLEVEKLKLEFADAEAELRRIMGMRPMQTPPPMPEPEAPDLGTELTKPYRISGKPGFDGSSTEAPLICWIRDDREIDQRLVDEILQMALDLRTENSFFPKSSPSAELEVQEGQNTKQESAESADAPETYSFPSRDGGKLGVVSAKKLDIRADHDLNAEVIQSLGWGTSVYVYERWKSDDQTPWAYVEVMGAEGWVLRDGLEIEGEANPEPTVPPTTAPAAEPEETAPQEPAETEPVQTEPVQTEPDQTEPVKPPVKKVTVNFFAEPAEAQVTLWGASEGASVETVGRNYFQVTPGVYYYSVQHDGYRPIVDKRLEVREDNVEVHVSLEAYQDQNGLNSVYVIFKSTAGNMSRGEKTLWQGMKLYQKGYFKFFDAVGIPDYTMIADLSEENQEEPEFDMGSGFTAAQIAEMRKEQEKKIDDLKLKVKMADAEYKIKKRELEDGNIYAEFDGKVVSLLTEGESRKMKKPIIKVSGGGGYQVEGSVNELDREKMKIGQEVTVNDWNSGESYQGKVISIGEFPIRSRGYNGRGNPNSSYYPFTAFVDGEANLQTGSYVSIQYSSGGSENGIYLENPFIREEKGQSYVYILGENNRLEKRMVATGKSLWGSYTEITSGLTEEDYLAFPYGKNVKPGVKAEVGNLGDFYN